MKYELEQWKQDIILATKGYYKSNEQEDVYDKIKMIISNINGCCPSDFEMDTVINWLWRVYETLFKIDGTEVGLYGIKEFMFKGIGRDLDVFNFLYSQIQGCRVKNKKTGYELILNLNTELATDNDYKRGDR